MVNEDKNLLQRLIKPTLTIVIVFLSLMHLLPVAATASQSETGLEEIGFYINARLPENQIDTGKTYFDLRMTPSQKQEVEIEVFNTSSSAINIVVGINNASTNSAGEVEYQVPDVKDEVLAHSLADIIEVSESKFSIPANNSKVVTLSINMPAEEFNGELLGGIIFTKENDQQTTSGMAVVNVYSFVKAIRLTENDTFVKPELEFLDVSAVVENYRTVILHQIRNTQPITLAGGVMNIEIYSEGSTQPKWVQEQSMLSMAPSSTMGHKIYIDPSSVVAGKYLSKITISNEDDQWFFEQEFEIKQNEVENLQNTVNPPSSSGINLSYVLLGVSPIILIVLIVIIYMIHRELKENKKSKAETETSDS